MSDPEPLFEALSAHLDRLGEAGAALFLAKAALALAHALDDTPRALAILNDAAHTGENL